MKISYSRFTAFLQNPERYRLRYCLGLKPEGEDIPTMFNYGRRRGSCVHAIHEARAKGMRDSEITKYVYPQEMYERCVRLIGKLPQLDLVPGVNELEFDLPIGDGKHSITGRIDHAFNDEGLSLGDLKSTGKKTKKEMAKWLGELETSSQAPTYLFAANKLGLQTNRFKYHVLIDDKDEPDYIPLPVVFGPAAVERTMQSAYAACEGIEFYEKQYGIEKPWPHSNTWPCNGDRMFCGFQEICGRSMPKGCTPIGFTCKYETEEHE